jgi:hypothetical protein
VWLPAKDAVLRARAPELAALSSVQPTVEQILHATAAAKLQDALEDNLLLAPIQSSVIPLPHQLYALNRAVGPDRIRYLSGRRGGLGKTIEAGLYAARAEAARPRQAHPGGRAQGAGAAMAGRNATALWRAAPFRRSSFACGLAPVAW